MKTRAVQAFTYFAFIVAALIVSQFVDKEPAVFIATFIGAAGFKAGMCVKERYID